MNHPNSPSTHNASKPTTNLLPHSGGGRLFSVLLLLLVGALNLFLAAPLQARITTLPAAPSNLAASGVSATQINLNWHDNSGNESGFIIQRSTSSAGPWVQIATPGVNATSYANAGLSAATTYYYRVSAYNSRGSSSYSNVASATTGQNIIPTCTYSILPTSASFPSGGGNGSSSVAASSGCAWTATSGATWITITAGSGTSSGTATYSVAANTSTSSRTGALTIAGQTFTVSQAAAPTTGPANDYCANGIVTSGSSATLTGSNVSATKEAGEPNHGGNTGGKSVWWSWTAPSAGSVTIDTRGSGFDTLLGVYTGTSVSSLTTIASNDDIGGGLLQSSVAFNAVAGTTYQIAVDGYSAASGNITLNLSQTTVSCAYSISSTGTSVGSAGASGNVGVTTGAACSWTASSGATWITITAGASGSGNGTVSYSVAANTATTSRTATLTIAGQTFTVDQAAASCTYAVSPASASAAATGASGTLGVTAGAGCAWTPSSSAAWLTCTPANGTANGSVTWSAAANTSTTTRSGTLNIAGQYFTVTQDAAPCAYTVSPASAPAAATGAGGTLSVTAGAGCAWTPSSSAAWLTCTPANGTGNGSVTWSAAANTSTSSRTGTLNLAGQTLTVTQAGAACTYTISPTGANPDSAASSGTLGVAAGAGCAWAPSSSASWLTCTPASGAGNGTVTWSVTANSSTTSRTATLSIAGQTFTVTQGGSSPTAGAGPWVQGFGGSGADNGRVVAVDGSGNICVAGYFQSTVDFGGGPLTSAGGMDLFLAKYTASGTHLWSLRLGGGGDEIVRCIALDSNGDIFVGGSFSGTTDLGGGALTSAGGADIFLAKYSSSGAYLWAKRLGGTADDGAYGMQVDSIGNLLVTGFFMRGVDLGGGFLSNPPGGLNTFVAKYSSAGAHVWSKSFWSSADNQGYGLVIDGNGDLVVTGVFSGQIDAGGGVLTTRGGVDGYLAKFSSAGVPIWSKGIGGANADRAECIAADSSGNLFVLGRFSQLSDWGGGPMTTASFDYDVVLAKYSPSGACLWAKPFAGPGDQTPSAVKTDANGNVVITGCFPYSINLGGLPLISAGMEDVFVAKYSSSGAHLWSERFGGSSFDQGIGLAVDGTGHVVVTGTFMGTADFGGQVLSSAGSYDAFLLRLDP